jgi:hypothetical protein
VNVLMTGRTNAQESTFLRWRFPIFDRKSANFA